MGVFLFGVGSLKSGKSECDFNVGSTFPIFKPFEGSVYISGSSHSWLRANFLAQGSNHFLFKGSLDTLLVPVRRFEPCLAQGPRDPSCHG